MGGWEASADYRNFCQWGMGPGLMGGFGFLFVIIFWVLIDVRFGRAPFVPTAPFSSKMLNDKDQTPHLSLFCRENPSFKNILNSPYQE
jgi:hypothetical protein